MYDIPVPCIVGSELCGVTAEQVNGQGVKKVSITDTTTNLLMY